MGARTDQAQRVRRAVAALAREETMLAHATIRAHGTTGTMITSGVALVVTAVVAVFLVAAYARPAAKAEFLVRLVADHATACQRLGLGPGTSAHAACMSELMHLNACPDQGF